MFGSIAIWLCAAAAVVSCGGPQSGHYVLRVDRTFDRGAQPATPSEELAAESYRQAAPVDRWEVAIEGSRVELTAIGAPPTSGMPTRLAGTQTAAGSANERRFELQEGAFAGGHFVIRGEQAELTIYGSGVPIVSSERGTLVAR